MLQTEQSGSLPSGHPSPQWRRLVKHYIWVVAVASAAAFGIAACSGGRGSTPAPAPSGPTLSGKIYVTNIGVNGNGSLTVYAANPSGTLNEAPLATITGSSTGLGYPEGMAVDANGKIYVANYGNPNASLTVYAANPSGTLNEAPLATITGGSTGLSGPYGIAVDSSGKIYVANSGNGSVLVFAANPSGTLNEAPLATITGSSTGLNTPTGIAVDANGKLYVANSGVGVTVYAANPSGTLNEAPLATIAGGPDAIALDASGIIYVASYYAGASNILVYAANPSGTLNEAPLATISGGSTGLNTPTGIVVH